MSHIDSTPSTPSSPTPSTQTPARHTAGLFDIRTIIGLLMAVYGVILTLMSFLGDPANAKTGGIDANLWAGLALLVVGVVFLLWARLRPVIVDEQQVARDRAQEDHHSR